MVLHLCSADCVCTTLRDPLVGMYTYTLHTNIHQYTCTLAHIHTYVIRSVRNRSTWTLCFLVHSNTWIRDCVVRYLREACKMSLRHHSRGKPTSGRRHRLVYKELDQPIRQRKWIETQTSAFSMAIYSEL